MLQYRVTFFNEAGRLCLAIVCAETKWEAVELVRNSISDYGCTESVEAQPLSTVIHISMD